MRNHWFIKSILMAFFFLTVSFTTADEDVLSVNAGVDQQVVAGDTVNLAAVITFANDEDADKKDKKHKKRKHKKDKKHKRKHRKEEKKHKRKHRKEKNHHKKHKKKHHKKHKKDHDEDDDNDNDDEIVIQWSQVSGTSVDLVNANTLTPNFTVDAALPADEVLVFTVTITDDEVVASDSVAVSASAVAVAVTSQIGGRITAIDGSTIRTVSVDVLSSGVSVATINTGANGDFLLDLDADSDFVLVVTAAGYANQVVPVRTPAENGSIFLDVSMIARGSVQSFDAATGATLVGADGAAVVLTANSFVDANGLTVTGMIDVSITPVDVSNPAALSAFPGEFSGILTGDTVDTPIISYGTVEYNFTQNGQTVQLDASINATANVLIPIYTETHQDGTPIQSGDIIPLWSLDEVTGIWSQEGTGTVVASSSSPTGWAMNATVSHFTWWNCDVSMDAAKAIVTVLGQDTGTALVKARTTANIGFRPNTVDTVLSVGVPSAPLNIPSNGEVCFWAEINFDNGSTGTTLDQCVTAGPNTSVNITLVSPIDGPLNIVTTPAAPVATPKVLDVNAFVNFPVTRVQLQPSTFETAVSYTILSGVLPTGLSLNAVNAVRSELVGVPTAIGNFSVVVQATAADGTLDSVTINYTVTSDVPPPSLPNYLTLNSTLAAIVVNLNDVNSGGAATSWYLPPFDVGPLPPQVNLDLNTGVLTIDSCTSNTSFSWFGQVIASNASGDSAPAYLDISCGNFLN